MILPAIESTNLWPTRDMAASLLSVPVPVSVVVAAPPLLANRRNPRLLGLWLALGSSLDLQNRKYIIRRQKIYVHLKIFKRKKNI